MLKFPNVQLWVRSIALSCGLLTLLSPILGTAQQVSIKRWLEVRQISGSVQFYRSGQAATPARMGTRLTAVGDGLKTGKASSSVLALDIGTGFVRVSEQTDLQVQQMQLAAQGGRVTKLRVLSGQVRLQVRPFNNAGTKLEIQTPAGVSGVRGTEFGISVKPGGKTGVATLKGNVLTSAQGSSVAVKKGFQSLVIPGEPPSPATPLRNDTRLDIRQLTRQDEQVRIVGQTDPVNLLTIADSPQDTDRRGQFDITIPLPATHQVKAVVVTPLGKQQIYELALP